MKYGSVCSGIEAATVAWHPLGWKPVFFAEIDKRPAAVLAHHYPEVTNFGDFTKIPARRNGPAIDVLVGGTPCQDFSIAGLRAGLDGDRGNLSLEFGRLVQRERPRWVVWENVPGVLSSNDGRDFAAILGLLAGKRLEVPAGGWGVAGIVAGYRNAYGLAWRVLDAQYVRVDGFGRAVPQRRRRVFVVGYSGDWRRAAAVLFERESLSGNPPPRRESGKGPAPTLSARTKGGGGLGTDFECDGGLIPDVAWALQERDAKGCDSNTKDGHLLPIAFDTTQITSKSNYSRPGPGDPCHPLAAGGHPPAIAFDCKASGRNGFGVGSISPTLRAMGHADSHKNGGGQVAVQSGWAVRRLTPRECERLQGFPEIRREVTVSVWPSAENRKNSALAETQSLKLPGSVCPADASASPPSANHADANFSISRQDRAPPVVLSVQIDLERMEVRVHKAGKLFWSASIAEDQNSSPLSIPTEDFVRVAALLAQVAAPITRNGKVELQQNTSGSLPVLSGKGSANLFGPGIAQLVADAAKNITTAHECSKSITSQTGHVSPASDSAKETLSCCVIGAIASFIPPEMLKANSFAVRIETVCGYTNIPWRGNFTSPDGPRYRELGNSFAVNVMRWLGRRIEMVDAIP